MATRNATFEVQIQQDGRWIMQSIHESEEEARASASRRFGDKKCEGARVIRNWTRADGYVVESTIFCETRIVKDDGPIRIAQIDSAPPPCASLEDFLALESRITTNRLFRSYLDKAFLTPTEVMHNSRELKRLQDKDTLLPSAIDRVAFLQTRSGDKDSKCRRDEIAKSVDDLSRRARRAESLALPKSQGRFSDTMRAIDAAAIDEQRDYLALVVLSRDLINLRNWVGKLEKLCTLAVDEPEPGALVLLDGVIADVLGSNVVQDILGFQPGLGQAIIAMIDLADGNLRTEDSDAGPSADLLNRLFAQHKLPASRLCLVDRAHRQLRSGSPLYRNDPTKEADEFKRVMTRLVAGGEFHSGAETALALTQRYTQMVEQGGAAGRRAAIAAVFRLMPDRAMGIRYLCELTNTPLAADHAADLAEQLEIALKVRGMADLCLPRLNPKERMTRVASAHRALSAAPFEDPLKARLLDHLDTILDRYVVEEKIIEKLDDAEAALRDRAVRLVRFCASGTLPEGKALSRARDRVVKLLRHPSFDAHFIDGISDPNQATRALRDFHQLLVKAGFG